MAAWTDDEVAILRSRFPTEPTKVIAACLGRTERSIKQKTKTLRILKDPSYLLDKRTDLIRRSRETLAAKGMKHGHCGGGASPTYRSWMAMHARCANGNNRYGGRGIYVVEEWGDFRNFLRDMGERPAGKTIGRRDNDAPYCATNCQWETRREQDNNKSVTRYLDAFGRRQSLTEWAREIGINASTLYHRIQRGVPVENALTRSKRPQRGSAVA